jgi:mono/diheme cytochrome c family protein
MPSVPHSRSPSLFLVRPFAWSTVALALLVGCSRQVPSAGSGSTPEKKEVAAAPAQPAPVPRKAVSLARIGEGRTGSQVVLATWAGKRVAFVADEDEKAVRAVDVDERRELALTRLGSRPGQILVSADGRLLVTLRDEAKLAVFQATEALAVPLERVSVAATAIEPLALAETPDGSTLLVASGWSHTLEGFREGTLEKTLTVDLKREPRAVATSANGLTAYVAHAGASQVTSVDLSAADGKVKAIDLSVFGQITPIGMMMMKKPSNSSNVSLDSDSIPSARPKSVTGFGGDAKGPGTAQAPRFKAADARGAFALASFEDGPRERIFVPHVIVAPGGGFASGYGGGEGPTQAFSVDAVDPRKNALAMSPQGGDLGGFPAAKDVCLLPSAAAVDVEGRRLLVACRGIDEVRTFEATSDHPTWGGVKDRYSVPAGANGIAVDGERREAVVWSAFEGTLSVLSLGPTTPAARGKSAWAAPEPLRIALERTVHLPDDVALGRRLFFTAGNPRIAEDGRACASCHIDGRDDGLVWASPQGSRQTMMLAGRVGHAAPFGWLGEHATIAVHLAQTLKNLKGTGLGADEVDALVAWLKVMPGPPEDARELTAEETHGREVFGGSVASCSSCHVPHAGAFRDEMTHDVASGAEFLTPSLRFAGGSAPYFHDGRYATLEDMLRDPHSRMSDARKLPPEDLRDLAAYVRTL